MYETDRYMRYAEEARRRRGGKGDSVCEREKGGRQMRVVVVVVGYESREMHGGLNISKGYLVHGVHTLSVSTQGRP